MARYKNGINGPVSGKVGSVIASSWRGVDYVKSVNDVWSKPRTEAQLLQQEILGLVNSWLKPVRDLIWIGFQVFKGTKTPMNAAVSLIMKGAVLIVEGRPEIDFPKVILSRGELQISLVSEIVALADGVLLVKWDNAFPSVFNADGDRATFVVYNPSKKEFVTFPDAAVRADREVRLQLPAGFAGDEVHTYLFYVNEAGDGVSTSQYLGAVRK